MSLLKDSKNTKWVVVQLSSQGEKEKNLNTLKRSVQRIIGHQLDVFIPAISQKVRNESHTTFYMDGYIFISFSDGINYTKLHDTTYFKAVLYSVSGGKVKYSLLDDSKLDSMRDGLADLKISPFKIGDVVKVTHGTYKNLFGTIIFVHDDCEVIQIHIDLKSKRLLMDFPSSYIQKVES